VSEPLLSVVVTIVDGGETLRACLDALGVQTDAPALDVIVLGGWFMKLSMHPEFGGS